jgi:L-asparaginase
LIVQDAQIERAASFQILNWMMQPIATQHLHSHVRKAHLMLRVILGLLQYCQYQNLVTLKSVVAILTTQVTFGGIDQRYAISAWAKTAKIVISDAHSHASI